MKWLDMMLIGFYTFYFHIFYSVVHSRMRRMAVCENHDEMVLITPGRSRAIEDVSSGLDYDSF